MAESSLVNTVFEWIGKLGTGAGAIWGVVSIVKKREFATKIELSTDAEIVSSDDEFFVRATLKVKNIGESRAPIDKELSYLEVCYFEEGQVEPAAVPTSWVTVYVFPELEQLEAAQGEEYSLLVKIPHADYLAFQLNFSVTTKALPPKEDVRKWIRTNIVYCKLTTYDANSAKEQ